MAQSKGAAVFDVVDGIDTLDDEKEEHNDAVPKTTGWTKGIVPYIIEKTLNQELVQLIHASINEFALKTPIKWTPFNQQENKGKKTPYVAFEPAIDSDAYSQIGCCNDGRQLIVLTYPYIPRTKQKWTKVAIMHEMMHALGFVHEQQRVDAKQHHNAADLRKSDPDFISDQHYHIALGHYDYQSIMHYDCFYFQGAYKDNDTKQEMEKWVGKSTTFSKGDLASIKILYGPKNCHYGEWHKPCSSPNCSDKVCYCGSCGISKPWCGWHGAKNKDGHWTCCMSTDKTSKECKSRVAGHTGFWHMECAVNCQNKIHGCQCGSCGCGCQHYGKKAHWSCCLDENFDATCTFSPFTKK